MSRTACVVIQVLTLAAILWGMESALSGEKGPLVALPMYELSDSIKKADDIFWDRLAKKLKAKGVGVPPQLERNTGPLEQHWKEDRLLLSQACGYPFVTKLMGAGVKLVATPVYAVNDDLRRGDYCSVIIVGADTNYKTLADLKGKKAGVNDNSSNSGMNLFRAFVASTFDSETLKRGVFESVILTGGHLLCVRQVAAGEIDVAAIDRVAYDLICMEYPKLAAKTRILTRTATAPGLPLVTSAKTSDEVIAKIRAALQEIVKDTKDQELVWALKQIRLKDFVVIDRSEYVKRINELEESAKAKGYPTLK
jgi:ABC-type phosphate/phosphonate transport system substrate-binding protein